LKFFVKLNFNLKMDIEKSSKNQIFERQIEELLKKEKKARQQSDHITSSEILQQIV